LFSKLPSYKWSDIFLETTSFFRLEKLKFNSFGQEILSQEIFTRTLLPLTHRSLLLGIGMSKFAILLLIAAILLCSEPLQIVFSQTSSSEAVSAPAIEWQNSYGGSTVSVSNLIQTTDGGYIFMDLGWRYNVGFQPSTVYKVDSAGNVQWSKTLGPYNTSEYLGASSIIQTNDGGYEIAGGWTIGVTYQYTPTLVKMDAQGNIEWAANYSSVSDLGTATFAGIRTSDGGFAYCENGRIIKTDIKKNIQWVQVLNYTESSGRTNPLSLFSLIETSDGALAILAVGEYHSGIARTGRIYLIKTEAFLPLPSQAPLPTPMPTSSPALTAEATTVILLIIVVFAITASTISLKKRKQPSIKQAKKDLAPL
jgi:hypothetical protein